VGVEEFNDGYGADVDRAGGAVLDASPEEADDRLLVLGIPVEGVPTEEVLPWPLSVSAPVLIEVSIGADDEFAPAVGAVVMLVSEPVAITDETLFDVPDDNGIVAGRLVEREPDGTSEPPVDVVGIPPGPPGTENTLAFESGTPVGRVVPLIVVAGRVATVVWVIVVSMALVNVVPSRVVGEIVNVSIVDEIPVFALPELNSELGEADGLLVRVEFVTGYGAELEGRTDMAEELPLALVRLAPEESSEVRGVPEDIDDVTVTMGVVNPPLGTNVELTRPDELVVWNGGRLDELWVWVSVVFDGCVAEESDI
jgi:hypothetical protein